MDLVQVKRAQPQVRQQDPDGEPGLVDLEPGEDGDVGDVGELEHGGEAAEVDLVGVKVTGVGGGQSDGRLLGRGEGQNVGLHFGLESGTEEG